MHNNAFVVAAAALTLAGGTALAGSAAKPPNVGGSGRVGPICADLHTGQMFYIKFMQLPCGKGKKPIYFISKNKRGQRGPRGLRGPVGARGPIGLTGAKGATGVAGAIGARGPTGIAGPKGDKGDAGVVGATGPTGPIGATGPAGPTGPSGSGLGDSMFYLCINANGTPDKFGGFVDGTPDCDPGHDGIILQVVFKGPPIITP